VIDFWSTWCGPCQRSLPSTNSLAHKYHGRGVVFLGVNVWDNRAAFKTWLPQHKSLDAIKFTIDPTPNNEDVASKLYNVSGIPTQYVIGRNGKVVASNVGFGGDDNALDQGIRSALSAQ